MSGRATPAVGGTTVGGRPGGGNIAAKQVIDTLHDISTLLVFKAFPFFSNFELPLAQWWGWPS